MRGPYVRGMLNGLERGLRGADAAAAAREGSAGAAGKSGAASAAGTAGDTAESAGALKAIPSSSASPPFDYSSQPWGQGRDSDHRQGCGRSGGKKAGTNADCLVPRVMTQQLGEWEKPKLSAGGTCIARLFQ